MPRQKKDKMKKVTEKDFKWHGNGERNFYHVYLKEGGTELGTVYKHSNTKREWFVNVDPTNFMVEALKGNDTNGYAYGPFTSKVKAAHFLKLHGKELARLLREDKQKLKRIIKLVENDSKNTN
jgi:hypothetical protein